MTASYANRFIVIARYVFVYDYDEDQQLVAIHNVHEPGDNWHVA